jgi:uncharacterized protein YkwD
MKLIVVLFASFVLTSCSSGVKAQDVDIDLLVNSINEVRNTGCKCGKRFYRPVGNVSWNDTLFTSAEDYAKYMTSGNFFSHVGPDGKNIGQRVEKFGYDWQFIGENLGKGQVDVDELIADWKKSYTHCILLMDPRFTEMGLAEYEGYWVLHLGKRNSSNNPTILGSGK